MNVGRRGAVERRGAQLFDVPVPVLATTEPAVHLSHIWPGTLLAALGMEAAKHVFALYLAGFASYDVVCGSLGGVFALLFWVY